MAGVKALRKIQYGLETTAGTAVNATRIWRGTGTIEDQSTYEWPEEDIGFLQAGTGRVYCPKVYAALDMEATPATFEELPYILTCAVASDTAGTRDSTGSGYVYSFVAGTNAQATLNTMTLQGGDNQQAEQFAYGFVESFTLEGNAGEALMVSAAWRGRQVSTTSFYATATLPAVEEILVSKGKLYIDDVDGTIGTTQKSNTLLGLALNFKTGVQPVFTADGNIYFSFTKQVRADVTLDLTFEHDDTAVSEIAAWREMKARQIRLLFEGSALTTAGTYSKKTFIMDMAGQWEKFSKLGDQNGNDVVTGTFRVAWDATAALFFEAIVVNKDEAL